jgi:broad specificity phosphatase PhoE
LTEYVPEGNKTQVDITYFVHGTSADNEQGLASGWFDAELSELGRKQALELGESITADTFDVVFCSDLKRAVDSAKLMFRDKIKIIQDSRLRECNLGDFTRERSERIDSLMLEHVDEPFPNGESLRDVEMRIKSFLDDLLKQYAGKRVAIVAHRAPQLALNVLLKQKTWKRAIEEDWRRRKEWRPGWKYRCKG